MASNLTIESNIPLPDRGRTSQPLSELLECFKKMKVGQSVVVDWLTENSQIYQMAKWAGIRVSIRKVDGKGWRVWRVG